MNFFLFATKIAKIFRFVRIGILKTGTRGLRAVRVRSAHEYITK